MSDLRLDGKDETDDDDDDDAWRTYLWDRYALGDAEDGAWWESRDRTIRNNATVVVTVPPRHRPRANVRLTNVHKTKEDDGPRRDRRADVGTGAFTSHRYATVGRRRDVDDDEESVVVEVGDELVRKDAYSDEDDEDDDTPREEDYRDADEIVRIIRDFFDEEDERWMTTTRANKLSNDTRQELYVILRDFFVRDDHTRRLGEALPYSWIDLPVTADDEETEVTPGMNEEKAKNDDGPRQRPLSVSSSMGGRRNLSWLKFAALVGPLLRA